MTKERKQELIAQFATHEGDTGSPEGQVALLTERINHLNNEHLNVHKNGPSLKKRSSHDGR